MFTIEKSITKTCVLPARKAMTEQEMVALLDGGIRGNINEASRTEPRLYRDLPTNEVARTATHHWTTYDHRDLPTEEVLDMIAESGFSQPIYSTPVTHEQIAEVLRNANQRIQSELGSPPTSFIPTTEGQPRRRRIFRSQS
jgi:hypothetical protein